MGAKSGPNSDPKIRNEEDVTVVEVLLGARG